MIRKVVPLVFVTILVTGVLILAYSIQPVEASGTIYIRADGSIDPSTALISTMDNVTYTFDDDIHNEIVVERGNIIIDGNDYTVQGTALYDSRGIYLFNINTCLFVIPTLLTFIIFTMCFGESRNCILRSIAKV